MFSYTDRGEGKYRVYYRVKILELQFEHASFNYRAKLIFLSHYMC